jgi:hypothetical protein
MRDGSARKEGKQEAFFRGKERIASIGEGPGDHAPWQE